MKYRPVIITVDQWFQYETNPKQRDTERRAIKQEAFLKVALPTHSVVAAGILPEGRTIKLDGHTRGLLWLQNKIPVPEKLTMMLYECGTMADIEALYDTFDNRDAVKNAKDAAFGGFRKWDFSPMSPLFQAGKISSAVHMAECARLRKIGSWRRATTIEDGIGNWLGELKIVDGLLMSIPKKYVHSGLVAGMLVTVRKRGVLANTFWERFATENDGTVSSPVQRLRRLIESMRDQRRLTGGTPAVREVAEKAIACCESHIQGKETMEKVYGIDIELYFTDREARQLRSVS